MDIKDIVKKREKERRKQDALAHRKRRLPPPPPPDPNAPPPAPVPLVAPLGKRHKVGARGGEGNGSGEDEAGPSAASTGDNAKGLSAEEEKRMKEMRESFKKLATEMAKDINMRGDKFVKGKLNELMEGKTPQQKERLMSLYKMAVTIAKKQREKKKVDVQDWLHGQAGAGGKEKTKKSSTSKGRRQQKDEKEGEPKHLDSSLMSHKLITRPIRWLH